MTFLARANQSVTHLFCYLLDALYEMAGCRLDHRYEPAICHPLHLLQSPPRPHLPLVLWQVWHAMQPKPENFLCVRANS
jgi:hypothetical protein